MPLVADAPKTPLISVFVDHSNMWGGARWATKVKNPKSDDERARLSIRVLDKLLTKRRMGINTKVVSGGIPPGMEGVWQEYERLGYNTQRLFRDKNWKEHGVDHSLIGHMWKLLAKHKGDGAPIVLVLASGDGNQNEFGTSFYEVVHEALSHTGYESFSVELASFDGAGPPNSPTSKRMKRLVTESPRGRFINLTENYGDLVFLEAESP